jgi:hypothetical protein
MPPRTRRQAASVHDSTALHTSTTTERASRTQNPATASNSSRSAEAAAQNRAQARGTGRLQAPNLPPPSPSAPASSNPGKARMKTVWQDGKILIQLREKLGTDTMSRLPTIDNLSFELTPSTGVSPHWLPICVRIGHTAGKAASPDCPSMRM